MRSFLQLLETKKKQILDYSLDQWVQKARGKGKKTQTAAEKLVSAGINDFFARLAHGQEKVTKIVNDWYILPKTTFPNGTVRPDYHFALVETEGTRNNRLLIFYQPYQKPLTIEELFGKWHYSLHTPAGGLTYRDGFIHDVWLAPDVRSPTTPLYRKLREYASSKGLNEVHPEELKSADYLGAEAKYQYRLAQEKLK